MESLAFRNRFLLKQRMHKAPQAQGTLTRPPSRVTLWCSWCRSSTGTGGPSDLPREELVGGKRLQSPWSYGGKERWVVKLQQLGKLQAAKQQLISENSSLLLKILQKREPPRRLSPREGLERGPCKARVEVER